MGVEHKVPDGLQVALSAQSVIKSITDLKDSLLKWIISTLSTSASTRPSGL